MPSVYFHGPVPESYREGFRKCLQFVEALPEVYLQIEKNVPCACDARDSFVVEQNSIVLPRGASSIVSYPCYALPRGTTHEELYTLILWLIQHQFKTFRSQIVDGCLVRDLAFRSSFKTSPLSTCCTRFTLKDFPIFFMEEWVVSLYDAGPNIESVCKKRDVQ